MTTNEPELRIAEAAARANVSQKTIQRRIAARRLPGAHLDSSGHWLIPVTDLMGEFPSVSLDVQTPADTSPEVERLRAEVAELRELLADERRGREVAEARAEERQRIVEDLRPALQALTAGPSPDVPPTAPQSTSEPPRRGWRR